MGRASPFGPVLLFGLRSLADNWLPAQQYIALFFLLVAEGLTVAYMCREELARAVPFSSARGRLSSFA